MCQHLKNSAPPIRVVSNKKKILIEDKLPYLVENYQVCHHGQAGRQDENPNIIWK